MLKIYLNDGTETVYCKAKTEKEEHKIILIFHELLDGLKLKCLKTKDKTIDATEINNILFQTENQAEPKAKTLQLMEVKTVILLN